MKRAPGMVAGQTTRVLALRAQDHGPMAGVSGEHRSHNAFDRPPTSPTKYTGETNPSIWLEDFRLACRAGGVDDNVFIFQYLPICVGEHVQVWLEFLPHDSIRDWADLKRVFVRNFQGTFVRPGNS